MEAQSKITSTQQPSNMPTENESAKNSGHYQHLCSSNIRTRSECNANLRVEVKQHVIHFRIGLILLFCAALETGVAVCILAAADTVQGELSKNRPEHQEEAPDAMLANLEADIESNRSGDIESRLD